MKGFVYIINTQSHNQLKIGFTDRDPDFRARELDTTGLPQKPKVIYFMLVNEPKKIERIVHRNLNEYRERKNREWFSCDIKLAITTIRDATRNDFFYENISEDCRSLLSALEPEEKTLSQIELLEGSNVIDKLNIFKAKNVTKYGNTDSVWTYALCRIGHNKYRAFFSKEEPEIHAELLSEATGKEYIVIASNDIRGHRVELVHDTVRKSALKFIFDQWIDSTVSDVLPLFNEINSSLQKTLASQA